jgi:hypothetical protein
MLATGPQDTARTQVWQAQLQALYDSLQFFGCTVCGEGIVCQGVTMDLTIFPAAFIRSMLEQDYRQVQLTRLDKY